MEPTSHCSLCLHPSPVDLKKSAFIFLDMDGVMINSHTVKKTTYEPPLQLHIAAAHHLDPTAVESLKDLIIRIEKIKPAYIILSSDWRLIGTLDEIKNQIFAAPGLEMIRERIIGKTPASKQFSHVNDQYYHKSGLSYEELAAKKYNFSFRYRVGEIGFWLKFHKLEDSDFIILDDQECEQFKLSYYNRFVPIRILSKSDIDEAMTKIFEFHKNEGCHHISVNKDAQLSLPKRFIYHQTKFNYKDSESGLLLVSQLAKKTASLVAKFLTAKGHKEKSIRLQYPIEPTQFPPPDQAAQFEKATENYLTENLQQAKTVTLSLDTLPLKADPSYFPLGMKITFEHTSYKINTGSIRFIMDHS